MPMDETQGNSNYALERLRALLRSDSLDADGKLPTERALSEVLGVGRRAVRRALEVLEAEGRIWRRQGSGTYAGPRPDGWSDHDLGLALTTALDGDAAEGAVGKAVSDDGGKQHGIAEKQCRLAIARMQIQ